MDLKRDRILIAALLAVLPAGVALAQAKNKNPAFRLLVAAAQGTYRDDATDEADGLSSRSDKIKLTGTEVQIAGAYKGWEGELGNRLLTPQDTPWWDSRNELFLTASYAWQRFRFIQPVLGLTQLTQGGDQTADGAPPAFIDKNTAAILGLRSSVTVYSFGKHGLMAQGRFAYHTSFEAKRNFGDEGYLGLGYFFGKGRFRTALVAGQLRNFFRAEKPDPDVDESYLVVRHTYVINRIGLYMEY